MSYIERIAEDWVYAHSDESLVGSKLDPLLIIEIIIESSASWSWFIISEILQIDKRGESLPMLVLGPMDSWFSRYAKDWIEFIEGEAQKNLRFKWALGGLRQNRIDDDIWKRIEAVREINWLSDEMPELPD